ncbi:MAG: hypothetical protein H8E61_06325, partial [Bacteroidetes bacterium]|nr:hypothetical protein [Bacteroidota bacterium]
MKRSFRNFNKMLLPFMMIFLSLLLTSYTPPASQKKVRKVKVVISNGELKINKNEFIHPWSFKLFMEALGEHNRVDPGVNDIYTYDKLGIILYKNPKSDEVTDFNIYLGSDPDEDYDFIPTGLFKDNLNIDGI